MVHVRVSKLSDLNAHVGWFMNSLKMWIRVLALYSADSCGTGHVLVIWPVSFCFAEDSNDFIRRNRLSSDHAVSWCGYRKRISETERLLGNPTGSLTVVSFTALKLDRQSSKFLLSVRF